jgi:DNA-binding CsgD family transcriptional regulator
MIKKILISRYFYRFLPNFAAPFLSEIPKNPNQNSINEPVMQTTTWLKTDDPALEEETNRKITLIQQLEQEIPAVIIIHDLVTASMVYLSKWGRDYLGITMEEIQMPTDEYMTRYFNTEDSDYYLPKILGLVERNDSEELISYFQQVRRSPAHPWAWYLSSVRIFLRDLQGKARLVITIAMPVDTEHPIATKVDRLLEENNFLRRNHHIFSSLTRREKEILKLMARGESSQEIAAQLHISETTANTHRRNIRNKIKAQTPYDVTRFARAFDLI